MLKFKMYTLVTALLTCAATAFAVESLAPQSVTPQDRLTAKGWEARHEEKLAQAKTGNVDLVMIGDSITQNWERQRNYADRFGPLNTLNLGFGGDRTQNVLWRIQNGELDGISPKLVTMMIGTNNSKSEKPEDIILGIQAIVVELRQRFPETQIIVFSIFPRKPGKESDVVEAVNLALPELADGKRVVHVDIRDKFLDKNGEQRAECYGNDLLHLRPEGYESWFDGLKPLLAEAGFNVNAPPLNQKAPPQRENGGTHSCESASGRSGTGCGRLALNFRAVHDVPRKFQFLWKR